MENCFHIAEFDRMAAGELIGPLTRCLAVERWARALADGRPYGAVAALLARADELSASLTDDEIRAALDDHPRIGDPTGAGGMSEREQSGVDDADAARLRAANVAYEQRFGHIYLVCASGRSGVDILTDLAERMTHDAATELGVVRRELGRIAHLRLSGMIGWAA
jgi:2-oxo-4-hydroxy-4-carboxy-5-ureidoimidazoline decarboxylase